MLIDRPGQAQSWGEVLLMGKHSFLGRGLKRLEWGNGSTQVFH
jgi:hypothetical protein